MNHDIWAKDSNLRSSYPQDLRECRPSLITYEYRLAVP
jgi:hypothetical protein